MNSDIEKTRILDKLVEALDSAKALKQECLAYLIEMALLEAKQEFLGQSKISALLSDADVGNDSAG